MRMLLTRRGECCRRFLPPRLCVFLGCCLARTASGQCHYDFTVIPNDPQGRRPIAAAINNRGEVAGNFNGDQAFIWSIERGFFELPRPPGVWTVQALDINDAGHIAGTMIWPNSGYGNVPFYWDGKDYTVFDMPAGSRQGYAHGLNNRDQVVGQFESLTGVRAFFWERGVFHDLGPAVTPYTSIAEAINDCGVMGGTGYDFGTPHVFRFADEQAEWLPEPPGIVRAYFSGMSNNGFTVGYGATQAPGEAGFHTLGIIWTPGGVHVVEPSVSGQYVYVVAVNDAGRAIGRYDRAGTIPFVWQHGVLTDLRTLTPPEPALLGVTDINNTGQIVGSTSPSTVILIPVWLPGDLTGDCHVGIEDLALVLSNFGAGVGSYPLGDVDLDGDVDLEDLAILLGHWGR